MKRTYKYALTAVLGALTVVPALAQNFPDVPDNHWAYEALAKLKKDGLLVGYPDGLFRGPRLASRYEMAVAIHATYVHLKNITDNLQSQIDAIKSTPNASVSPADIQSLKDAVAGLQNQVNGLSGQSGDIANLKKLADTFQKELQSLGVDVEALKKDLADIDARVTALEKKKPAVNISGDVNLLLLAGNSVDDHYGLNKDGRVVGVATNGGVINGTAGLTRDLTILHEGAFTFAGTNETGPTWKGTVVVSNMLSNATKTAFGSQSSVSVGKPYGEADSDWYVQDLGVKFSTSILGLGFNAEAGRIGYKVSPYILQRPDTTSYYVNDRWDDGLYRFDGAKLGFNFGAAKLDVFGGKNAIQTSATGVGLNPLTVGADWTSNVGGTIGGSGLLTVNRTLGANLNVPLSSAGNVNVAYLFLDSDNDTTVGTNTYNRVSVYGGSADYKIGAIKAEGGYSQSDFQQNTHNVVTKDNNAYYGKLSYENSKFSLFGGYREVAAGFAAPGDWGRLGVIRNPVNIKGFEVGGKIGLGSLTLSASGEFDKGKSNDYATVTGFGEDTKITKYEVKLGWAATSNLNIALGYEDNLFEKTVAVGGARPDAKYRWTTLDIAYGLSEAARLLVKYEYSDVTGEYVLPSTAGTYKGGFLTTQLSLKF